MGASEVERLATVETKVDTLVLDVREIKSDVKALLLTRASQGGATTLLVRAVPFVALLLSGIALWPK